MAGAAIKAIDELGLSPAGKETAGSLKRNRLLLDQALDGKGFAGLKVGVHI